MDFAERLRNAREIEGLTQREAAFEIGVSVSTFRSWEQGRKMPSSTQILAICKALKIRSEFLFRDSGVELVDLHWA